MFLIKNQNLLHPSGFSPLNSSRDHYQAPLPAVLREAAPAPKTAPEAGEKDKPAVKNEQMNGQTNGHTEIPLMDISNLHNESIVSNGGTRYTISNNPVGLGGGASLGGGKSPFENNSGNVVASHRGM